MLYPSTLGNTPPTTKITPHGQSAICATSSPDGRARPHDSCAHARSVPWGGGDVQICHKESRLHKLHYPIDFFLLFSRITYLVAIKIFI